MKSKLYRTISAIMLSALLAVTVAASPATAATGAVEEGCNHDTVSSTVLSRIYPNVTDKKHQVQERCLEVCQLCGEARTVTRTYSEDHIYGSDQKCIMCRYYHY